MPQGNESVGLAPEDRVRFEALLADLSSQFVNLDPALIDVRSNAR